MGSTCSPTETDTKVTMSMALKKGEVNFGGPQDPMQVRDNFMWPEMCLQPKSAHP